MGPQDLSVLWGEMGQLPAKFFPVQINLYEHNSTPLQKES